MKKIFLLGFIFSAAAVFSQMPLRKAFIGIQGKAVENGVRVDSVFAHSTMEKLKIKKGDVILSVNEKNTPTLEAYGAAMGTIWTGEKITVKYRRNGKSSVASAKAVMKPYETSAIADIIYDWVPFKKGYLRAMTYKPKGTPGKAELGGAKENLPCILLIPGYGCGSIENYSKSYNGKLIDDWIRNGFAVVTIEKSGLGDSFGCEPCAEVDLQTDIESFDKGYQYMEKLPFVDQTKLFIWGHSMGGTIAPEIAKLHQPKGVMVFGCVFRPWSEFLLEMHRVQKPLLENLTYEQTEDFTRQIHKIYYEFFIHKNRRPNWSKFPNIKR